MAIKHQKGLSLIELMIAMLLGLVVIAAVIEIFLGAQQMYRIQDAKSRIQENGRYAMQVLSQNVMDAGYYGCATRSGIEVTNTLNSNNNYLWDFATAIEGKEATGNNNWNPAMDPAITQPLSGSDVITIRSIREPTAQVTNHPGGNPPGSANIQVNSGNGLQAGDIVMVTDCQDAAIFQISAGNPNTSGSIPHNTGAGTPGNATQELGKNYENGWINRIQTQSFYIRQNPRQVSALYRRISNGNAEELVEGVESMQLRYGVDEDVDGGADRYLTANNIGNWNNVVSVQIELLLFSLQENLTVDGPQTYLFDGNNVVANDNRIREVFTRTITLRNRTP